MEVHQWNWIIPIGFKEHMFPHSGVYDTKNKNTLSNEANSVIDYFNENKFKVTAHISYGELDCLRPNLN